MNPPDDVSSSVGDPSSGPGSQTDTSRDADVHAFLIADVRGYTAFTQERGDEEAGRLAGRFAEVTRSVVEDHRGKVLELRGDEALVVFGSPRSAIRGAVALQQRFVEETIADPSLPLTVGIGLDAGEAVAVEGGYRGGALNVAARLCSLARAGEVLASREIVHLALRVDGVRFTERGPSSMKGLDKPVHVVAVRSEDRDDALAIAPFVRATAPPPRRRWKAVAAVVTFAVVAALIAFPLVTRDSGGDSEIEPNSIGILDPDTGALNATVGLEDRPGSLATSTDAVWVTHPDVGTVTRIDRDEQAIVDTIQVGENPTGIAVGFDAVWVVESGGPTVSRISPETNAVVETIPVGNGPAEVAIGEASVWVTNRFDGTVSRIDPDTGEAGEPIAVGSNPSGIAVGFDSVWVGLPESNTVARVDPDTNAVTPIGVGNTPGPLAIGAGAVWVVNTLDDTVSRIDPDTSTVVDVVKVGDGPSAIAVAAGRAWVANEADGSLSRIDPASTSASGVVIGSAPQGLAGTEGDLWVSVSGTATSHYGGTLRLISAVKPDSLDPAVAYSDFSYRVMHLLGDGLVTSEPIGGTNPELVPDLATSIPTPTDNGRTYVFELRPGIRYSTGEVVAPADIRRGLERSFRLTGVVSSLYGRLVGAEACADVPDTCDLSRGIVTDDAGRTITFHLVGPDPDFLYKLVLPFAYPVPPSTPDEHLQQEGVPGTGPYMLEAPMTRQGLALVSNPQFRVWSPTAQPDGYVDRIEWRFGVEPQAQLDAVAAGDADVALDEFLWGDRLEDLYVRFSAQVHTDPSPSIWFLVLDTRLPPFDDVEVRRALNLAVDRERIVPILGGAVTPTCQQIPPNFPGYEPYCPYTSNPAPQGKGAWTGSDLEQAKRLVRRSGTSGMEVVFAFDRVNWPLGPGLGDYMVELLDELGYRVTVQPSAPRDFYDPANEFHMALAGWGPDYPGASTFFLLNHTCDATFAPESGFCDPRIDTMIDRALEMQADDPAAASALWAEIDRAVVDQAPYLWLVNRIDASFVSERVGNYQWSPVWNVLLNQLWVR
jgi:YVTN family beta-propeller protein